MSDRELPARPNLEQYKKQAKDLVQDFAAHKPEAFARARKHHPRIYHLPEAELTSAHLSLTDAQLILAREHGFESWPKFAHHIEMVNIIRAVETLTDPVAAFIETACVPRHTSHSSGTLEHAEMILAKYPDVASSSIHTAAILADEAVVRRFLTADPASATVKGGPYDWDALTYLCFSRYLRIDKSRSESFVCTAKALLDAGASANTGWYEMIDHPNPRPVLESAIYGTAGIAQHAGLTRLLLDYGADPNDEETPYHVPEGYDNTVMTVLLESGRLNKTSLTCLMIRKADWHDLDGMRLVLEHGGDPNEMTRFKHNALQHSMRRDNGLQIIELLIDHGADPSVKNQLGGRSSIETAAHRGRGDVLALLEQRGVDLQLAGVDRLIAACAKADRKAITSITTNEPHLVSELIAYGGHLLAEFAGNGNAEGIECLLGVGVSIGALYNGDPYFEIAPGSTALHVAAWRAWPAAVKTLIAHGAPVDAVDARGRTALALAVRACVDSYWKYRRTPESVQALLEAGAAIDGIEIPSGYNEVDELLRRHSSSRA